jgi:hypothetical protein
VEYSNARRGKLAVSKYKKGQDGFLPFVVH